jgi:hypothetical protein
MALPSHLRVVNHLSHERSEQEATTCLAAFKARTDGRPPLFTSKAIEELAYPSMVARSIVG